mmetsp:Transcript_30657/g.64144  ORF Transcript_30657/g.64144 Transcript_30657/m.64144 type:complete len:111 (+) Transcript_30657:750-1082(+)
MHRFSSRNEFQEPVRGNELRVCEVCSCNRPKSESMDISGNLNASKSHPGPSNGGDEVRNLCSTEANFGCSCTARHIIDLQISWSKELSFQVSPAVLRSCPFCPMLKEVSC